MRSRPSNSRLKVAGLASLETISLLVYHRYSSKSSCSTQLEVNRLLVLMHHRVSNNNSQHASVEARCWALECNRIGIRHRICHNRRRVMSYSIRTKTKTPLQLNNINSNHRNSNLQMICKYNLPVIAFNLAQVSLAHCLPVKMGNNCLSSNVYNHKAVPIRVGNLLSPPHLIMRVKQQNIMFTHRGWIVWTMLTYTNSSCTKKMIIAGS